MAEQKPKTSDESSNTNDDNPAKDSDAGQSFVSHLVELRSRLLRAVLAILIVFIALLPFANELYTFLADPLMRHLPEGSNMVAIDVASPFLTPFKLAIVAALFIALPYVLFQVWSFVAPGLYQNERRVVMPLIVSSTFLFYLGAAFAYFVVFPLVFGFFTSREIEGVAVMTDIAKYLDFVLVLFLAFGFAFEVPIATILLTSMGITTPDKLAKKRPYVIVGAFALGMLLTPPDAISQTLLAIPMWILFELGIVLSRFFARSKRETNPQQDSQMGDDGEPSAKAGEG